MPIHLRVGRLFAIVCAIIGIVPLLEAQGQPARRGTGVITGVVRDDAGRPVVYASVSAVRRFKKWNGPYYTAPASIHRDETDDRGVFRLHSLLPGTYFVSVVASLPAGGEPIPSEGIRYLTTFFPGTPSLGDAGSITIEDGTERSVTITLAAVNVTTVSGTVLRSDGSPAAGDTVVLLGNPSIVGAMAQSPTVAPTTASTTVSANGAFELKSVPAGTYTLQASNFYGGVRRSGAPREIARLPLTVAETPVRDLKVVTAALATARGRVVWDDGSAGPLPATQVRAVLVGASYLEESAVRPDGTFALEGLYGRTRFEVIPAFRATVSAVQAPSAVTAGRYSLNFTPGTVVDEIKIVMTRRVGRFVATVVDETEKPLTTASVILLPARPDPGEDVGTHPGSAGMDFLPTPRGNDRGEYVIEDVLPGAYLAVAVDIPPYQLNLDSDLMERARAAAIPIELAPGELRRTLHVVPLRRFSTVELTDTGPRVRH